MNPGSIMIRSLAQKQREGTTYTDFYIANNAFANVISDLFTIRINNAASYTRVNIVNNLFYNCNSPLVLDSGIGVFYNKADAGSSGVGTSSMGQANSSGPGNTTAVTYFSETTGDLHLASGDAGAGGQGTNWPGNTPSFTFNSDKDGVSRPSLNWALGPYEPKTVPALVQSAYMNEESSGSNSTMTENFSTGETPGDFNIVVVSTCDSNYVTSVTDNASNTYTEIGSVSKTSGGQTIEQSIWYCADIATPQNGNNALTIHFNVSGVSYPDIRMYEYSGATTVDTSASNSGTSGEGTAAITTSQSYELAITSFSNNNDDGWTTPGQGFNVAKAIPGDLDLDDYVVVPTAGTVTDSPSGSQDGPWVSEAVALK